MDNKQIALIKVACRRLGLEDDEYRAILRDVCGVKSSTELDHAGFGYLMDYFRQRGFVSDWHSANYGDRAGMASASQIAYIRGLWGDYTTGAGTDQQLGAWLEKFFGISALRFLRADDAQKAITALTKMVARRMQAAE